MSVPSIRTIALLCVLLGASVLRGQETRELIRVNGDVESARLNSLLGGIAGFKAEPAAVSRAGLRTGLPEDTELSVDEFIRWGSLREPDRVAQVRLTDGSLLLGEVTRCTRVQIVLETDLWGELTLPRSSVKQIVWSLPDDRHDRWRMWDEAGSDSDVDVVSLKNGDRLSGRLVSGDRRKLRFASDAGELELRVDLVASWQASGVESPSAKTATVVGLSDGTHLVATDVRLDDRLHAKLACGVHLGTINGVRPVKEDLICFLQPRSVVVQYLSDVSPLGFRHISFLKTKWGWGRDRNVLGGPVSDADRIFAKGIGMHSTSRLAFDLPEGFSEFHAEAALDRSAGEQGSVTFRVFVSRSDSKWIETFRSSVIRGGDVPSPIRIDIRNARRIALVVDFADRADLLDRANWIDARLVKLP